MTENTAMIASYPNTGFITVRGDESVDFLQSILTANVETLAVGDCRPGALLTPQGRILIDMMIYRSAPDSYILRTDSARSDDLFNRLRRYRLRRPVVLARDPELRLALFFGSPTPADRAPGVDIYSDPRDPSLGAHLLFSDDAMLTTFAADHARGKIDGVEDPLNSWHGRRIAAGVPEGPVDLTPERALMLEAGLDRLGAVDFDKGCYIGQEVTARTHYRGLIKRRLVPLMIDGAAPETGSVITFDGTEIGHSKTSAILNPSSAETDSDTASALCLALLKLTDIHRIEKTNDKAGVLAVNGVPSRLVIPEWMRPLPEPK